MKINDTKEVFVELEKFLKTGRFSFAVLTWDNRNKAVVNELIVKYDKDKKPMLYMKNPDGELKPIITESDSTLKDFLENYIEISVDRTKNYEPSLWFMLRQDENGNTGWNKSTVSQFYNFIDQNMNKLKPYMLQVFNKGNRDILVPFIGTQMVYYDVGRLVKGEGIENFDNVINILYNLITDIKDNLIDIMNAVQTKFDDMNAKLVQENERQNIEIENLGNQMKETEKLVAGVLDELGDIRSTTERRLRSVDITVGGNANTIYPVKLKYTGGGSPISGGTELFMGAMFLQMESPTRNIVMQIGNDHMTTSPAYYTGNQDTYFVYTHKVLDGANAKHYIYDCIFSGSGEYVVLLRGGTKYKLWTKYPDFLQITNNLAAVGTPSGDISPIPESNKTRRPMLTDDSILGADVVRTFVSSVHVVNSVMVGNKIRLGIGG